MTQNPPPDSINREATPLTMVTHLHAPVRADKPRGARRGLRVAAFVLATVFLGWLGALALVALAFGGPT